MEAAKNSENGGKYKEKSQNKWDFNSISSFLFGVKRWQKGQERWYQTENKEEIIDKENIRQRDNKIRTENQVGGR